jgi:uncharacterized protein YdaU (DUF1376 family)
MNQYPHHIGDFNNATRHLTRTERSIYSDMIDMYYDTESPLTLDVHVLKRKLLARTKDELAAVDVVLAEFFTKTESGWFNDRCDAEITKYHSNQTAKAQAGKASAAKREQARLNKIAELNGQPTEFQQPLKSVDDSLVRNPTNQNHKPEPEPEPIKNTLSQGATQEFEPDLNLVNTKLKLSGMAETNQTELNQILVKFNLKTGHLHQNDNEKLGSLLTWFKNYQQNQKPNARASPSRTVMDFDSVLDKQNIRNVTPTARVIQHEH